MCKPALWALCVAVAFVAPSIAFAGGTYHHAEWVPTESAGAVVENEQQVKHHLLRLTSRKTKPAPQRIAAHKHKPATQTVVARRPAPKPAPSLDQVAAGRDQTP
jgi:hypothetical protein